MTATTFISVGENIHCTRIFKVGGKFAGIGPSGKAFIAYKSGKDDRELPVPAVFTDGADWQNGRVKHCAVAIWQGVYGDAAGKAAGIDYLQSLARKQEALGATYLDINVDEFSTDVDERRRLIEWTVRTVQQASSIPMSIDSSNGAILRAGLKACDPARGRPMVNSVSLERAESIATAAEFKAVVIASAAGEKDLPSSKDERLANIARLMPMLRSAGFEDEAIHLDPLVFPISVDGENGVRFLDTVRALRETYGPRIHIVAGLSNISFGMPNRKLINQVFTRLAVEAGADGGIVDPVQINARIVAAMDPSDPSFTLASDLLLGRDEFGMAYIEAFRDSEKQG